MTDAETTAAVEALIHRVKARDQAIRDGEDHPDAEPFALEYLTALRGQGWRPTPAKVYHLPQRPAPIDAPDGPTDDYRAIRAEWEARSHPHRSHEDAGGAA